MDITAKMQKREVLVNCSLRLCVLAVNLTDNSSGNIILLFLKLLNVQIKDLSKEVYLWTSISCH